MKTKLIFVIFCIVLIACVNQPKDEGIDGEQILLLLLQDHKALSHDLANVDTTFLNALCNAVDNEFSGLVYIADGGCSFCIKNFLAYCDQIRKYCPDPTVNVIISKRDFDVIRYYQDMCESAIKTIYFVLDEESGQIIERMDYSGLLISFRKGKINDAGFYLGES